VWVTKAWLRRMPSSIVAPHGLPLLSPTPTVDSFVVAVSGGLQPPSSVVVVVVVDAVLFVVVVALRHSQSLVSSIFARYSVFGRLRSINKHQWASTSSTSGILLLLMTRAVSRSTNAAVCFTRPQPPTVTDGTHRLPDGWNVQVPSCWGTGQD
jgi:hypothetical protein